MPLHCLNKKDKKNQKKRNIKSRKINIRKKNVSVQAHYNTLLLKEVLLLSVMSESHLDL